MSEALAEQPADENLIDWKGLERDFDSLPITDEERLLTEVDQLNKNRLPDGSLSEWTLNEQFKNMLSATKEAAMPYAVTKTEHEYRASGEIDENGRKLGAYTWLGKTAVEHAMSGNRYHRHKTALERVDVEVDEARDSANLRPGITKVFISPRMTRRDASYEEAKSEHLADDDAVRISAAIADEQGNIQKRVMESLLVRDIPLEAWVDFLNDSNNIFGKSIKVENDGSATSVMKAHKELEIDSGKLKNGVISIVEAVIPYIQDKDLRENVTVQLGRFYEGQEDMHAKAINIAKRWQDFEVELADSLLEKRATLEIRSFINSVQTRWGDEDLKVILKHQLPNGEYEMSRELAVVVERAKQNFLWTRAGVVTKNEKVLKQLDSETAAQLYRDEMFIQVAADNGSYSDVRALEARSDRVIAGNNIQVGGGCAGENTAGFNSDDPFSKLDSEVSGAGSDSSQESKVGRISKGKCVIETCPTRPGEVKVGGCGVCLERCQKLFDQGKDPSKMKAAVKKAAEVATKSLLFAEQQKAESHEFSLAA